MSSESKGKDVRTAIINLIKAMSTSNGYFNNAPSDRNIKSRIDQQFLSVGNDDSFPKVCVGILGGQDHKLPGLNRMSNQEIVLHIGVKQKKISDLDPQDQLDNWLQDVRKLIFENDTLGGIVHDIYITDYILDGGVLAPEGVLLVRLMVEGFKI